MPERGFNRLSLTLTSELLVALNKFSGKRNQGTATSALWILTKTLKPQLDEINPQAYDTHIKKYSKTVTEQIRIKDQKTKLIEDKENRRAKYILKQEQWTNLNRYENELRERRGDINREIKNLKETREKLYKSDKDAYKKAKKQIEKLKTELDEIPQKLNEVWKKRLKVTEYLESFTDSASSPRAPHTTIQKSSQLTD